MSKNTSGYNYQTMSEIRVALQTTDSDVATAGSDDSDVYALDIINTQNATKEVTISYYDGSNTDVVCVVSIPANSGIVAGVYAVELIKFGYLPKILSGPFGSYIRIKSGSKIKMKISSGSNNDLKVLGYQNNF